MKPIYIAKVLGLAACICITLANTDNAKTTNAHPSSTGAPGESTCTQAGCHDDGTVKSGTGTFTFTFNNGNNSYIGGQTYDITIDVNKTGIVKFGFEILALKAGNINTGTWTITDTKRTQTQSGSGGLASRKYVTHTSVGTATNTPGSTSWSFKWTAPPAGSGTVNFYVAVNCTNNNNFDTGDQIFNSSFSIPETTTSITEFAKPDHFFCSYDATSQELNYSFTSAPVATTLQVYDITGKVLAAQTILPVSALTKGSLTTPQLPTGLYMVAVSNSNVTRVKKVYVY